MDKKETVLELLKSFRSRQDRLITVKEDEMVYAWHKDYQLKKDKGISKAVLVEEESTLANMVEREKAKIFEAVEDDRKKVELTKLLLLELDHKDREIIKLRYLHNKQVKDICRFLFISKSAYYRKHAQILKELDQRYRQLMENV